MTRTAILLGVTSYRDGALADLRSPRADVDRLEAVLKANGHFDRVRSLYDPGKREALEAIEEPLVEGRPGDLVLVSFSGHGLTNRRGRLHLAFGDTRPDRLESTAVSAETLQRLFKDSRVAKKVLLLDCCYSGAFADGFATRSAQGAGDHPDFQRQMGGDDSAGTYVLAASGAIEPAYEGDNTTKIEPSPFTAAVVRGLSGAAADSDGDGWIDTVDLYQYVYKSVDRHGGQHVTGFSLAAQGAMKLARHVGASTAVVLDEPAGQGAAEAPGVERSADRGGAPGPDALSAEGAFRPSDGGEGDRWDTRRWKALFDYYSACLSRQSVLQQLPDVAGGEFAVLEAERERILSGEAERIPLTGAAARIAESSLKEKRPLRYGYPAVLFAPVQEKGRDRKGYKAAPLLVMDVEARKRDDGGYELLAAGEPELNRELLLTAAEFDEEAVEDLFAWFEADWGGTGAAGLADRARALCGRLGLEQVQDLVAGRLDGRLEAGPPFRSGARNAAMLHAADPGARSIGALVADLDHRSKNGMKPEGIASTALASFADPGAVRPVHRGEVRPVVTGHGNAAQERILESAMRERLTVATGAPGTGKSELITSVVTTAVAAGESVLVASTNNTAVDEVVRRANGLLPGVDLVVRTGNAEKQKNEAEILTRLRTVRLEAANGRTGAERLDLHQRGLADAQAILEEAGAAERRLAVSAPVRDQDRARVAAEVAVDRLFPDAEAVRKWRRRVDAAIGRGWTAPLYRWWVRRSLRYGRDDGELAALAEFLGTELEWCETRMRLERGGIPEEVHARIADVREKRREDGRRYLAAQVARALAEGGGVLDERLDHLASRGSTWVGMGRLIRVARAWAVTSRSARVFPPKPALFDLVVVDEASQCTIADVLPLLFRAERALVIGDPHQLQPVNPLGAKEDRRLQTASGLDEEWLDDRSLAYTRSSAYHASAAALARADREVLWLDEHYRCHPDIVAPVNRRFYGNRLAVRTRTPGLAAPARQAVQWIDVQGATDRPGGRSCRNTGEADEVVRLLRRLWTELPPDADIGVATPFTAQKRELEGRLSGAGERIRVGTVHTFQGGERDVMVVSPAAATGVARGPGQWAARGENLWNVAVTRARSRLYLVGDQRYWSEQEGLLADFALGARPAGTEEAPDGARGRLFGALETCGAAVEVGRAVHGYACDLVVSGADGEVAVIIDRAGVGDPAAPEAGRTLLRALDEAALFEAVSGTRTVRVPVWRCWTEPEAVAAELVRRAG
ncbi:caspase, EACC1-associated type [Nocardiopsis potens]|uniref:caspase, EACC1-associated type n=1 Tax=Nocardiopsis potens TaxID=1246458 RepID=UPI00034B588C|nr:AAA domain-containing protein [Nocardiopsis potens]